MQLSQDEKHKTSEYLTVKRQTFILEVSVHVNLSSEQQHPCSHRDLLPLLPPLLLLPPLPLLPLLLLECDDFTVITQS